MEITNETKWTPSNLGPRMAKAFNEAINQFSWEAKTKTEITDFGEHSFTEVFGGSWQPAAAPALLAIKQKYNATVTGANYKDIIADMEASRLELRKTRPVIDKRTTPEQRAERERILREAEEKRNAETAYLAGLQKHQYGLAETSKIIKRVLSVLFPATTFSVRSESYSMGNSINVNWTDGPTTNQVKPILDVFQRAHFDGMEDMEHHIKAIEWNGHLFDFTGKYVSGDRKHSAPFLRDCVRRYVSETQSDGGPVVNSDGNYAYVVRDGYKPCGFRFSTLDPEQYPAGEIVHDEVSNDTAGDVVNQIAHHTSCEAQAIEGEDLRSLVLQIVLGEVSSPVLDEEQQSAAESQATASTATAGSKSGITVSENKEKGGIEIRFAAKPDRATLDTLKAHHWRWSRFSSCWYTKASQSAREFAYRIAGLSVPSIQTNGTAEDYPCTDAGYEEACERAVNRF